ncbi:MAG: hypothetical protein ACTSWY_07020 [Promethearchaeota archaeon]
MQIERNVAPAMKQTGEKKVVIEDNPEIKLSLIANTVSKKILGLNLIELENKLETFTILILQSKSVRSKKVLKKIMLNAGFSNNNFQIIFNTLKDQKVIKYFRTSPPGYRIIKNWKKEKKFPKTDFRFDQLNKEIKKNKIEIKQNKEQRKNKKKKIIKKETLKKKKIKKGIVTEKAIDAIQIAREAINKRKMDEYDSKIDILEFISKDMDQQLKFKDKKKTGSANYYIEEGISPCISCKYIFGGCPKGIDMMEMESVTECEYYIPLEQNNSKNSSNSKIKDRGKTASDGRESISSLGTKNRKNLSDEKKKLLDSILNKWKKEHQKIKIFCAACEMEMIHKKTLKKEKYVCPNFPECKVEAKPRYISVAMKNENRIATNRLKADLIVLYKYDKNKNIVNISEIYSEEKIFL